MKFFDKSKKPLHSKRPKRQPDPILVIKSKSEKLGSSQRKRLQKRIKRKYGKEDKSHTKKPIDEVKEDSDNEENSMEHQEDEHMSNENVNGVKKLDGFESDNACDNEDAINAIEELIETDSESDVSMNNDDDVESVIEDNNEDDMITNISVGDNLIKVTDLDSLNSRIKTNMDILNDFKEYKKKNVCHPRNYYVDQYIEDLCMKFSYNKFLMKKFYDLFNTELFNFLQSSEEERPVTIRTNTLKTSRRQLVENLVNRECNVQKLNFSKVGLVVYSTKCAIGATPEYLAGHYLLQGSSSMLPVMALAPKRDERILDLCAAPGGKTTHIAQMMVNTGIIFANDINKDRLKAVACNLARMGVMNTTVTVHDGRSIHKKLKNFDRVLCDAPCTGTGVISKDKSIKASKDEGDLKVLTAVQKQLICSAIDACKVNGFVVYSTCSVLVEENEQVVDYACRKRNVKLVETGLFGVKGFVNYCSKHFNKNMDRTRRYYPHQNNMDGFFLAKFQKVGEMKTEVASTKSTDKNKNE